MAQQIKDPVLSQLWLGSQLWHRFHPWTLELRMRVCPPPKNLQMDSRTDKGIQGSYKNQVAISDTTKCLTLYGSKWKKGWKEAMMNKLVKLELWICCDPVRGEGHGKPVCQREGSPQVSSQNKGLGTPKV